MRADPLDITREPVLSERRSWTFERASALLILLPILLGFALRVLRLGFQPLWWDEGYSVWFATHPLPQLLALTAADIHPPLYYILLRGWIGVFGPGPIVLRVFSVLVGVLAIPLIYVVARRMFAPRVGWLAAFLLAINPMHIYYSQEVRMYGLAMLLGLGALGAGWAALEGRGGAEARRSRGAEEKTPANSASSDAGGDATNAHTANLRVYVLYILMATAALYTLYYAALIPIGLTVYALLRAVTGPRDARLSGRALARWFGAQAAVALLYLPWLLYATPRLIPYVSQKVVADADRPLGPLVYVGRHLSAFLTGHLEAPLTPYWPFVLLLLFPLGVGVYLSWIRGFPGPVGLGQGSQFPETTEEPPEGSTPIVRARTKTRHAIVMLAIVLGTALALGWLIGFRFPFFPPRGERLLLIVLPAFLMLAAVGVDGLLRANRLAGYVTMGLIGAVAGASLTTFYLEPRYPQDDYRPLIARTVEQGLPGDMVFAVYPWQVGYWRSYGNPNGPTAILSPDPSWGAPVMAALDDALARGRVWFPAHLALGGILESRAEAYLAYKATPFLNEWFGAGTRLSAWGDVPPGDALPWTPVRAGDAVELTSVRATGEPVAAANALTGLALGWRADAEPPPLAVSVRLTDALGQIWAQYDYAPLGGLGLAALPDEPKCTSCNGQKDDRTGPWNEEDAMGLLIPAGTPPGDYQVEVVVHPVGDARPLDFIVADGASVGTAMPLYPLTVTLAAVALDPARLPIAARAETDMANSLRFLGHTAADAPAAPGDLRKVNLFWQALSRPPEDAIAFVQLLDGRDAVVAGWEAPPGAAYPTSAWPPGTLIRTQAALRIPAGLPDGRYRLIAGLYRADDKSRILTTGRADHLSLGDVTLRDRPHTMTAPNPQHPADATFDGLARLVGYDLGSGGVTPGETLPVTLHWQALGATDRPYTVFVHLVDAAGNIRGYGDGEPGGGAFSTTGWLAGEYIADAHTVTVTADAPPGAYRLEVGLYDPATGQRLLTANGSDHVVLDVKMTVEAK